MTMKATSIAAAVVNSVTMCQLTDSVMDPGAELFKNRAGGSPDVSFVAAKQYIPKLTLTTQAVKQGLDLTGLSVIPVTTVDAYYVALAQGAFRASGSVHYKATLNEGAIFCRKIAAQNNQEATMGLEVIASYDGTNAVWIHAGSAALPSSSLQATEKFTNGPLKLGSTLWGTESIEIDPNIAEFMLSESGEPYIRLVGGRTREVVITATSLNPDIVAAVAALGGAQSNATAFLRKISKDNDRVADATAEHISFVAPTGYAKLGPIRANDKGETVYTVEIHVEDGGTNAPITLDTTAVIA